MSFKIAEPFPHSVVLQWTDKETCKLILEEWRNIEEKTWKRYRDNKFAISDLDLIPPAARNLIQKMYNGVFLDYFSDITDISNLIPDWELNGAGLHETRVGGKLGMHVDFNRLGKSYRRLNLLIYLNPYWGENQGGWLHLGLKDQWCTKKISPAMGMMVLLSVQQDGWHGHPVPLADGLVRRSIALYYYTKERPKNYVEDLKTTKYRD